MWVCCADSSYDDDEHNTGHTLLFLFADAFTAPALRTSRSWTSSWWVALDIFTVLQQCRSSPEPDLLAHDPGHDLWFGVEAPAGLSAVSTDGRASLSPSSCCQRVF